MSECRALTNFVGNGVATLVVARWEGALDRDRLSRELAAGPNAPRLEVVEDLSAA
ncbi:C4-dicarboxylate transport protein [compost metagenome]